MVRQDPRFYDTSAETRSNFTFYCCVVPSAVMVSQKPGLDYITFNWNEMTATDFEERWREKKMTKEADFIHMIQVGVATVMLLTQRLHFNHTWDTFLSSVNVLSVL